MYFLLLKKYYVILYFKFMNILIKVIKNKILRILRRISTVNHFTIKFKVNYFYMKKTINYTLYIPDLERIIYIFKFLFLKFFF